MVVASRDIRRAKCKSEEELNALWARHYTCPNIREAVDELISVEVSVFLLYAYKYKPTDLYRLAYTLDDTLFTFNAHLIGTVGPVPHGSGKIYDGKL